MSEPIATLSVMRPDELLERIRRGHVRNIDFSDFVTLMTALGFTQRRKRGSHHIFAHPAAREFINVQNVKGQVKPYQVRQLMKLIHEYNLSIEVRDE